MVTYSVVSIVVVGLISLLLDRFFNRSDDRPMVRKAFLLAMAITPVPFAGIVYSAMLQQQEPEDAPGLYEAIAGAPIGIGLLAFVVSWIAGCVFALWPVVFRVVAVERNPKSILKVAGALALGYTIGTHALSLASAFLDIGQSVLNEDAGEPLSPLAIATSTVASLCHLIGQTAYIAVGTWAAVVHGRPILGLACTLALSAALTFPVIFLPASALPDPVRGTATMYIVYVYYAQMLTAATLAVAVLAWMATRPEESMVEVHRSIDDT